MVTSFILMKVERPRLRSIADDLLAIVDGRIILAKGGAKLVAGLGIDPQPGFAQSSQSASWAPF